MNKITALLLLIILASFHCIAQSQNKPSDNPGSQSAGKPASGPSTKPATATASVSGKIADTIEKKPLQNGVVVLLRSADSIITRFTRTDKGGNFLLKDISPGRYLLLVSYPSYADYVDQLEVRDSSAKVQLPDIGMVLKSALLQQVVVTGNKGAIHIKGDTIEFKADSFHTQAGATVEDLLKKLPGIQVDKNGKITAQGETIQKVLVDGEEFFGDDPTLVTQNLRADMVDKVKVYDKKSDQAAFTGIDDGQKTKVIDLKLKDNKKNGYFGNLSAASGTDGFYDEQAMINVFRKKRKLAAYGIASNTGKIGLNWNERDNYGQSDVGNLDYDETSGFFMYNGTNDDLDSWDGKYNGQGLPVVKTGGVHYNDKWNDDRQSVNGNYKVMELQVKDSSNTRSEYILPDTLYYNNQTQRSDNRILRHSANGYYEIKLDSTSSLKITADGGTDHKTTHSAFRSEALARDSSQVNSNDRTISTVGDKQQFNSNLLWRKKLPKKGRTLSLNLRENYTNNSSSGYLNSDTRLYTGGLPVSDSLTDQYKSYHARSTLLDSRLTYTEPLSAVSFLTGNYGVSVSNDRSDRSSFNRTPGGKYSLLDSLYSNDYQFNVVTQKGGLAYSFVKKKLRITAGNNIGFTVFDQKDVHADTMAKRNFINWYPQATLTYSFSNQQRLNFRYNGSSIQPTVQEIQPIVVNEDPLNIVAGNPGLKPQFRNSFFLFYNDYKVMSERGIWINMNGSFTQNAISNSVNVDSKGRRVSQSVNVNGNYSFFTYIGYNFKWKKPNMHISWNANINQSNNVSIVNNLTNNTRSGNYTLGFGLYKSTDKKYDLELRSSITYTKSQSSINTGIVTDYWTGNISPSFNVYLPLKFQVHADCDINLRQRTGVFGGNNNVTLLNAWIGKKFLKKDALQARISGNDLLDQNTGFDRTVNSNFISQRTYNTIRRYFMFTVAWNFTKAGTAAPANR